MHVPGTQFNMTRWGRHQGPQGVSVRPEIACQGKNSGRTFTKLLIGEAKTSEGNAEGDALGKGWAKQIATVGFNLGFLRVEHIPSKVTSQFQRLKTSIHFLLSGRPTPQQYFVACDLLS